jgi:hypothetical protein
MSTTTITRTTCKYPGCGQPAAPAAGPDGHRSTAPGEATPAYRRGGNAAAWPPSRPAEDGSRAADDCPRK